MSLKQEYTYPESGLRVVFDGDRFLEVIYPDTFLPSEKLIDEARWLKETFDKIADQTPNKKILALIDVSNTGPLPKIPTEAKKIYWNLLKDPRVEKIALFGNFNLASELFFVLVPTFTHQDVKTFSNKEEALKWLKK